MWHASGLALTIALLAYLEFLRRGSTRPVRSDRDIAYQRSMTRDLERIRFAADHAGEAIFLIDPSSRFLCVNKLACAITQCPIAQGKINMSLNHN
jgi:hypothetical protein